MMSWQELSTLELINTLSDYHKDVYGYRLVVHTREEALEELARLDDYLSKCSGEELADNDWTLNETV